MVALRTPSERSLRTPTRRALFKLGAATVSAGGVMSILDRAQAAGASTTSGSTEAGTGGGDAEVLQTLLTQELLMVFVYEHVLHSRALARRASRLAVELLGHEREHARAISQVLRSPGLALAQPPPSVDAADAQLTSHGSPATLSDVHDERDALRLLIAAERVAEGAYYSSLLKLSDPRLSTLAVKILSCQAQHEAVLGSVLDPGNVARGVPYAFVQGTH